jgi:hypothetical protein
MLAAQRKAQISRVHALRVCEVEKHPLLQRWGTFWRSHAFRAEKGKTGSALLCLPPNLSKHLIRLMLTCSAQLRKVRWDKDGFRTCVRNGSEGWPQKAGRASLRVVGVLK